MDHGPADRDVLPLAASFALTARVLHADGHEFPVLVRASIDYDEDGTAIRISGATSDLTATQLAERAKDAFVSTLSHELRTPLTAIGGAMETLLRGVVGELDAGTERMVELANRNVTRLRSLVDDLLDLEGLLAGQATVAFEPTDHDPLVLADAMRLTQVTTNYLSNALRYAPRGSAVRVTTQQRDKVVRTCVIDHGPGVPSDFREHVFEPFAQAETGDTRSPGGTGLGLAIVHQLVEQHGGAVGFDSEPGYTCFWFELPRHEPADLAALDHSG